MRRSRSSLLGLALGACLFLGFASAVTAAAAPRVESRPRAVGVARGAAPARAAVLGFPGTTLYDNTGNPADTFYVGQGGNEAIDDLHMTAAGSLDLLVFESFDPAAGGTYSATVKIYGNPSGLDLAAAPVFGTYVVNGIPRGRQSVTVPLPDAPVAGPHVWVGVRFTSSTAGLVIKSVPSMGSSHDLYVESPDFDVWYTFGPPSAANFALRVIDVPTYTLTVATVGSGSVTKVPDQATYLAESIVNLTATPAAHWHFTGWSGDASGASNPLALVMDADKSVTATFAIDTYTLSYSPGTGGSIEGWTLQTVDHGANGTTVLAVPNPNYHFVSWSDGVLTAARTDVNVTANLSVTAMFAINTYTLEYFAGPGGTIAGADSQTVDHGEDGLPVTATPNTGYHFVGWSDAYPTAARRDLDVTADVNVTATFEINVYTLSYGAGTGGTVSGATAQTVTHGGNGTAVTALPNAGFHFVSWSDGLLTAGRTDLGVVASLAVTATFARDNLACNGDFEIDLGRWSKYGSVDLTRVAPGYASGWAMQIKSKSSSDCGVDDLPNCIQGARAGDTYRFTAWVKAGSSSTRDRKVKLRIYEYDGSSQVGSYVSTELKLSTVWQKLSLDYVVRRSGTSLSERIVYDPDKSGEHFFLDELGIELLPPPPPPVTFTITATAGPNGSIAPAGVSSVIQGASKSYTITPSPGSQVVNVVLDGTTSLGPVPSYTFTNVQANRTIHATFAVIPPGLNLVTNPSFESGIQGWTDYDDAELSWNTNEGRTGTRSLQVNGDDASNGCDDSPNWVGRVAGVGARYQFRVWIKAANASSKGKVKIRVYELDGGSQVGSTVYSPESTLTQARWVPLTAVHTVQRANTALSMRVTTSSDDQTFLVDDVSIELLGALVAQEAAAAPRAAEVEFARPTVYPNPGRGVPTLGLSLATPGALRVELYDVAGRVVRVLANDAQAAAGTHRFALERGRQGALGAGIYFYRAEVAGQVHRGRFVILE